MGLAKTINFNTKAFPIKFITVRIYHSFIIMLVLCWCLSIKMMIRIRRISNDTFYLERRRLLLGESIGNPCYYYYYFFIVMICSYALYNFGTVLFLSI